MELDRQTLETLGFQNFGGAVRAPFTAHPKVDPATGNLLGVICSVMWALTLIGLRWGERHGERIGISAVVVGNAMAFAVGVPSTLKT